MKNRVGKLTVGLLASILLLSGCSDDGSPRDGDSPGALNTPQGEGKRDSTQLPTNIPPGLLECGSPLDDADGYFLIDADLTEAEWSLPDGWQVTHIYEEENSVEKVESIWTAEPSESPVPLNVLVTVIYSGIDWEEHEDECGRVPVSAISDRLEEYNDHIGAEITKPAEFIEFAGVPAITQDVALDEYSYTGVWLFSRTHLLHTYCQWTTQEELVRQGCEALYDSFEIPVEG